jgi:anti-sigma regulatory factor (Ser/Thr protein kinase)
MKRECPETGILKLLLPSRVELLGVLDKVVEGVAEELGLKAEAADTLAIAIIEAGTNAIQHGHKGEVSLCVDIRFEVSEGDLVVCVRDQGPGFDLSKVERDLEEAERNPFRTRGRGIQIMRSIMDEVSFQFHDGEGTTVKLVKRLGEAAEGRSLGKVAGD